MKLNICIILFLLICMVSVGQNKSQIREYESNYVTYPYSDANPIPVFGKIYPYFRYEGFTTKSEKKAWKIVELENDFLKIMIFPEIGGKIWSVVDKSTGKEMFYGNEVVKFRDVALRGAWTSGGIEFNYGVIGHSPACSFPVDYLTHMNEDGSASCIIGALDLLTRTYWNVEINLPKDKVWFTTRSFWHNRTGATQPYYSWVNTAVNTRKDLEFIYPGTKWIGHEGLAASWPLDSVANKNMARWSENNYAGAKSYHIVGKHRPYFGAYWKDDDFGVMQYSNRDDKLGKKIWIWALSDEGKIWEEFLTDKNGQYAEIQSGRLFNQNLVSSSTTPYKQVRFTPYGTDTWTEYWFPFNGTGGVSNVTPVGVIHVEEQDKAVNLLISPLQTVQDTLKYYDDAGNPVGQEFATLLTAQVYKSTINVPGDKKIFRITFGNQELWSRSDDSLSRPVETVRNFDWESSYGKYLRGRDLMGFRLYDKAEIYIRESLKLNPDYVPALVEMSKLYNYRMDYDSAFSCAQKALSIDTYDAAANYEYGRSAKQLKKYDDALDGFEVASLTEAYRSAAYTEISKLYLFQQEYAKSMEYAQKSLINNQYNVEGWQLIYLICKLTGKDKEAEIAGNQILQLEPLNHFVRFEKYFNQQAEAEILEFQKNIRGEMREQTFLELAVWYSSLDLTERSKTVLGLAPENAEIAYWQAFLAHKQDNGQQAGLLLKKGASLPAAFVFPFREESEAVLQWAVQQSTDWQPRYYLSLLYRSRNDREKAYALISAVNDKIGFSPFYAFRTTLTDNITLQENDLKKAASLSPDEWRYTHELTRFYLKQEENKKALGVIAAFYKKNQGHFPTGLMYVRALLRNKAYARAEEVFGKISLLPSEGDPDGHLLYRATKMLLAAEAIHKGNMEVARQKIAEARQWPRNLGVGKPYDENIDARLEDWLQGMTDTDKNTGNTFDYEQAVKKIEAIVATEYIRMF
ncbi:MAG: DUF5107 domain-containing protein [Paludibacter sp.]|nr:DUF5107 domain-containing protein [Paludibacter sp.]